MLLFSGSHKRMATCNDEVTRSEVDKKAKNDIVKGDYIAGDPNWYGENEEKKD